MLGDIRGSGLVWGIEVVTNKQENLPVGNLLPSLILILPFKHPLNIVLFPTCCHNKFHPGFKSRHRHHVPTEGQTGEGPLFASNSLKKTP